jgi:copper chaperone CopZ
LASFYLAAAPKPEQRREDMGHEDGCGCSCGGSKKEKTKVNWSVSGIKCQGSAGKLETALKEVAGVKCASVKVDESTVAISFDADQTSEAELKKIISKGGVTVA